MLCGQGKWDPPFNPQCTACALNFYQDQEAPTPVDCKACPESAVTAAKGSDDVSKCLCSPGFFGIIVRPLPRTSTVGSVEPLERDGGAPVPHSYNNALGCV